MNHLLSKAPRTLDPGGGALDEEDGLTLAPSRPGRPVVQGCQLTCLGQCRYGCGGCWTSSCQGHCSPLWPGQLVSPAYIKARNGETVLRPF